MPQIESCAVLEPSRPPAPDRYCPVCDKTRDPPQPFRNYDGRWFCGACYFEAGHLVEMKVRARETAP